MHIHNCRHINLNKTVLKETSTTQCLQLCDITLFVCMNTYILVTIRARYTKFVDNVCYYWMQLMLSLEIGHASCPRHFTCFICACLSYQGILIKGYTNFVLMFVADSWRHGRPHKVHTSICLIRSRLSDVCLSARLSARLSIYRSVWPNICSLI